MREKLRDSRGETLVEVLASVMICALSITLLFGAVMASGNIDLKAQAADEEYYGALSRAERQDPEEDTANDVSGLSVWVENTTPPAPGEAVPPSTPPLTLDCAFYGSKRLLSYAVDQAEETPPPVPGPGGGG